MKKILTAIILIAAVLLSSCTIQKNNEKDNGMNNSENGQITYTQISAEEAKRIMDTETGYVIIDARTESEYAEGHIPGALLIPEYEVKTKAEGMIPNKDTKILVYCRSGRRSKIAAEELIKLGYTNVYEFGGIIDWKYDIVK